MAEGQRMTAAQVVDKLMGSEHVDVLRESVAWLVAELIEAEVSAQVGAAHGERAPERRTTQRNGYRPRQWDTRVGTDRAGDPQAALRQLHAVDPRAAPARRAGARRRRPGGLRQRRLDAQGRPARRAARAAGHEQRPGLAAVPRPGRAGADLPRAPAGRPLPVPLARWQGRARARG